MSIEEIEVKLFEAGKLLSEVAKALQELKKPSAPAQVMQRIAQAHAMRTGHQASLAAGRQLSMVLPNLAPKPERKERAYHYLRLSSKADDTNDKIYRVVGQAALAESNRIEAQMASSADMYTQRLDSRQFQTLVKERLKLIREGAKGYVGCTEAEDLQGAEKHNNSTEKE